MKRVIVILVSLSLGQPLLAQTAKASRAKKKQLAAREVAMANYSDGSAIKYRTKNALAAPKQWNANLGIASGFATASTNNTSDQRDRDNSGFDKNTYLGVNTDIRAKKYVGLEAEGYLDLAPQSTTVAKDAISGQKTQDKSLQQYGALANLKAQYPYTVKNFLVVTPKAGVGYGFTGLKTTSVDSSGPSSSDIRVSAPYYTIGLDIEVLRNIVVAGDYARSFGGSASRNDKLAGVGSSTPVLNDGSFNRFRAGAYYKIAPFTVGLQYVHREISYLPLGESVATVEKMNQYLAVLMFGF